jgi:predicted PurR-regulated permease PerM
MLFGFIGVLLAVKLTVLAVAAVLLIRSLAQRCGAPRTRLRSARFSLPPKRGH